MVMVKVIKAMAMVMAVEVEAIKAIKAMMMESITLGSFSILSN
jgi:hypothetical protein